MKKLITGIVSAGFLFALLAIPVLAVKPNGPAASNGLNKGKSPVQHLELYQKDPETWQPVEDGRWGRMTFDLDSFIFNGHKLIPGEEYALIVYDQGDDKNENEWPGEGPILAQGVANNGGNLNLSGELTLCFNEAKIWLVLAADVNADDGTMKAWHPTEYLFEYDRVTNCQPSPPPPGTET